MCLQGLPDHIFDWPFWPFRGSGCPTHGSVDADGFLHGLPVLVWFLGHDAALSLLPPLLAGLCPGPRGVGPAPHPGVFFLHHFLEPQADGDWRWVRLAKKGAPIRSSGLLGALQPPATSRSLHPGRTPQRSRSPLPKRLQTSCENQEKTKKSIFAGSKYQFEPGTCCAVNSSFGKASCTAASAPRAPTARTCGLQVVHASTYSRALVHVGERITSLCATHTGCAWRCSPVITTARARRWICWPGGHPPRAQRCQAPARTSQQRRRPPCRLARSSRDHDRRQNLNNHVGRTRIFRLSMTY